MYQTIWAERGQTVNPPLPIASDDQGQIFSVLPLLWEEHCIECTAPHCFKRCSLYRARKDLYCARFENGILEYKSRVGDNKIYRVRFTRWAKIEAGLPSRLSLLDIRYIEKYQTFLDWSEKVFKTLFLAFQLLPKTFAFSRVRGIHWLRYRVNSWYFNFLFPIALGRGRGMRNLPTHFLAEFFSESPEKHIMHFELIRSGKILRKAFEVKAGWNTCLFQLEPLFFQSPKSEGIVRLWIENDAEITLWFKWLDFINLGKEEAEELNPASSISASKVKVVAWDLDNTVWKGVIGDAGADSVIPDEKLLQLIKDLNERGILQSVVSKNTYDIAWKRIQQLDLDAIFLYPKINWQPKSANLIELANDLNVDVDSFALVDDSDFERGEVQQQLPQVRCFTPTEAYCFLERSEFNVPVTPESKNRRLSYQSESRRKTQLNQWQGTYEDFLKRCDLQLFIERPSDTNKRRSLELIQRSNQFNLSKKEYSDSAFEALITSEKMDCYCFYVKDRFGDYGNVGFVAIEKTNGVRRIMEFVMSCRVAQKEVERTFVDWYSHNCLRNNIFKADFVESPRNGPLKNALKNIGFEVESSDGKKQTLVWRPRELGTPFSKVSGPAE